MQAKRITVIVAALAIGIALTAFLIYASIPLPLPVIGHLGFGTTPEKFAYSNVMLLVVSFSGIAFIWLDYFLGTQFLKS